LGSLQHDAMPGLRAGLFDILYLLA
jgi:hypothetical protein